MKPNWRSVVYYFSIVHFLHSTLFIFLVVTNGLAVKPTLNPRHRNADLPFSQLWHPSERRPLLPSTEPSQRIHLSPAGLEKADGTREPRSKKRMKRMCDAGAPIVRRLLRRIQKATHLLYFQPLLFSCCDPYGVAASKQRCTGQEWSPFAWVP